ncbi:MAG: hypothetical protein PHV18_12820 [Lachnospiraceae bacterium]|nr:hypothetical protein [Lachnospiraceae bacterium]
MKNFIKRKLMVWLVAMFVMQSQISAYAGEWAGISEIESINLFTNSKESRLVGNPKGRWISSIEARISDEGGGDIGVYADVLCHEAVQSIRIWIYLEHYNEENQIWETFDKQEFEWLAEDFPGQELTMATVSYNIPNQPRGQYYRLQGRFGATSFTNSSEAWRAFTDGLYIE